MGSEVNQPASTQPDVEGECEFLTESHILGVQNHVRKQLRSSEILTSAVTIFSSNFKFMFLMILSILPLCVFMIFYEIKLQNTIDRMPLFLDYPYLLFSYSNGYQQDHEASESESKFFSDFLRLCVFFSVVYPVLEVLSIFVTVKLAANIHSHQPRVVEKEILDHNNLLGTFITYLCVHLLSASTYLVLFWVVVNHHLFSIFMFSDYYYHSIQCYLNLLSVGLHSAIFIALLYKYLGWSACLNMGMVISVLEEETGIGAFGLSDYYGKHCKQTGFRLMLIFFTVCNVLRLPALIFGLSNSSSAGICVTAIVIGLFCLGNVVKWVAFVLYYYDCKQQVMEKKGDGEVGKSVKKVADAC